MTDKKFQRFGKYLILDHLVDGGMAKICRARYLGEQANKIVAVKMVQSQFSKDPSFVQMFEDELKVTFGLLHPNIAQVYDYGMVEEQLFTAMEYVDGANLKQFLDRLKEKNFVFPVEISTYIVSQVCQALHYAHTFTDKLTGKPFRIIHRDISPHNIMLAYDGTVKVIDFGIAKADSNSEATQAGTIKGKLSYLAPEYLEGMELDHRYDQFAVGITLWEMLCSRKLFTAKNDLAVLKQIQSCNVPAPSSINPNVPKELDEIVAKALSKDRNERFENMDKFNRALVKFLYSNYPDFNATDLGYFAKQLFKEEIVADKKKFVEFGKIDITPYLQDIKNGENGRANTQAPAPEKTHKERTAAKVELDFGDMSGESGVIGGLSLEASQTKKSVPKPAGTAKQKIKVEQNKPIAKEVSLENKSRKVKVERTSNETPKRKVRVDSDKKSGGKSKLIAAAVASIAVIGFFKFSGESPKQTSTEIGRTVNSVEAKKSKPKKNLRGTITFSNFDPTVKVYLNGVEQSVRGIQLEVKVGETYKLEIKKKGYKRYSHPRLIQLKPENRFVTLTIPALEEEKIGFLSTSRNYTSGSQIEYVVEGQKVKRTLPLRNERLPAGEYEAVISNPLLGTERKVYFTIEEAKKNYLQ